MRIVDDIAPTMIIGRSQGSISDPQVTYNQAGISYNQANLTYGGLYGPTDTQPILSGVILPRPIGVMGETLALLEDQGITYNQSGVSYNQVGIAYGGIYNYNQEVLPILSQAFLPHPRITNYADIYTTPTVVANLVLLQEDGGFLEQEDTNYLFMEG